MQPVLPAYGEGCIDAVVPAILERDRRGAPAWAPEELASEQVVLLVLDGLGWEQLRERSHLAPTLTGMAGGPITSVAPTTTATALTSISTGLPPAAHGVVGYRVRVADDQVMNVLRWRTPAGDARRAVPPEIFQPTPAFGGRPVPAVTRAEFASTGFTAAHLAGARLRGWRVPSTMAVEVAELLAGGEPFVYAYYDGLDKVAHEWGLGRQFEAELVAVDRLVGDLADVLTPGAVLLVTSDHGQVMVGDSVISVEAGLLENVVLMSGEGRFRWLHVRPGATEGVQEKLAAAYGEVAWVLTRQEMVDLGWFGGELTPEVEERLGDVALVAREPVAFLDPADTGEVSLVARHGSLTAAETWVPLLALRR